MNVTAPSSLSLSLFMLLFFLTSELEEIIFVFTVFELVIMTFGASLRKGKNPLENTRLYYSVLDCRCRSKWMCRRESL